MLPVAAVCHQLGSPLTVKLNLVYRLFIVIDKLCILTTLETVAEFSCIIKEWLFKKRFYHKTEK